MDAGKVQAVVDWPTPRSVQALCGFLGLAWYYRKYVKDYGALAAPLTQLLRKDSFEWSPAATEAFQRLKTELTTTPILTLPDFSKPFVVRCGVRHFRSWVWGHPPSGCWPSGVLQ
ncbi:hypothetical protein U9M48_035996 [Paspalum notatum var. saurae]|uniref:Reverse transcriptase/retrotransposon-derived protein RNase H-like domain-containing protein n=1 Tax=Paspalum notatum var. saurae TaxID=547442 RepID=A0AAQ3UGC3_PASNO